MELGIFAKTYGKQGNVDAIFKAICHHRISGVHFNMACSGLPELPIEITREKTSEVHACARKHKVEIIGLSATFNMIDRDLNKRARGLKSLEALAKAAKAMGTNLISVCTGTRHSDKWTWHPDNATTDAWKDLIQTMEQALLIADRHEVVLGIEPETGNVVRSPQLATKLLYEMASPRLKIILDPANLFEKAVSRQQVKDLISEAMDQLHPHMAVAHAKDRTLDGKFKPAGHGDVDFHFFVNQLKLLEFSGPLVLHGLEPQQVSQSVSFLRSIL